MLAFGMDISVPPILCEAATVARLIMEDTKIHTLTRSASIWIKLVLKCKTFKIMTDTNCQLSENLKVGNMIIDRQQPVVNCVKGNAEYTLPNV